MTPLAVPPPLLSVFVSVADERARQLEKFGDQVHLPDGTGRASGLVTMREAELAAAREGFERLLRLGKLTMWDVLREEMLEVACEDDPERLRKELVQVAAVACQWVEYLDRRIKETQR